MGSILEIQNKIRDHIIDSSYIEKDQIANDTLIFAQGIMDSMGFISILDFIEESFNVIPEDDELLESNFESINAIINFITRKKPELIDENKVA